MGSLGHAEGIERTKLSLFIRINPWYNIEPNLLHCSPDSKNIQFSLMTPQTHYYLIISSLGTIRYPKICLCENQEMLHKKAVTVAEWLAHLTTKGDFSHPTPAETCMWGKRPAATLAIYTGKSSHQRWISENIFHVCLHQVRIKLPNLALKIQRRHHQKSKTGVSEIQKIDMCPPNDFFKI